MRRPPKSALAALSAGEKAAVLDRLLTGRADLRKLAETYAAERLSAGDREAVAADVGNALQCLDIDELNGRAGPQPGRGYVHPVEAAAEILDEALQPFLDDLARRAGLGMSASAVELAAGVLLGLYRCRDGGAGSLLEESPDYAHERAPAVVDQCARLGLELPAAELLDLMPEWGTVLR
ncbi:MAG: hypothetical protein GEV12_06535 [Micromonosporaceae bacterium]|nr:hypothetical protein [Micromonosporaceae bacterium]